MSDVHPVDSTDPLCPDRNCLHRHKPDQPCWVIHDKAANRGGEACTHAARCLFCDSVIESEDGHTHIRGGLVIHEQCKLHVPAGQRREV